MNRIAKLGLVLGGCSLALTGCEGLVGEDYIHWVGNYSIGFTAVGGGRSCMVSLAISVEGGGGRKRGRVESGIGNCTTGSSGIAPILLGGDRFDFRMSGPASGPEITFEIRNCQFTGTGSADGGPNTMEGTFSCTGGEGVGELPPGSGPWQSS
jgi:hypothetical protein